MLEEREAVRSLKLEALRKRIDQGLNSLNDGEGNHLDVEAIKARGPQAQLKDDD